LLTQYQKTASELSRITKEMENCKKKTVAHGHVYRQNVPIESRNCMRGSASDVAFHWKPQGG
jgi:hypothetical protein